MESEAAVFKALSDPTRLRLTVLLAAEGETCVCELAQALDAPSFKISKHLAVMRAAGLVQARREGSWIYYSLARARNRVEECLQECFRVCLVEHKTAKGDRKRLSRIQPCSPRVAAQAPVSGRAT